MKEEEKDDVEGERKGGGVKKMKEIKNEEERKVAGEGRKLEEDGAM